MINLGKVKLIGGDSIDIRKVTIDDLEKVKKLHNYCTGRQWTDSVPSKEELGFYTPNEILGMFNEQTLMAMIRNYTFNQCVRGELKKMGGISHVATFPEYRFNGYMKVLIKAAFIDMKEKHQCVSTLHPFNENFYEKFGYVGTNDNLLVRAPLDGFSHYLKNESNIGMGWKEQRRRAIDVQTEFETFKLQLDLSENHGLVFLNRMSMEYWKEDHEDAIVIFIKKNNEVMAAAKYIKMGYGENGKIFVCEMYWKNIESRVMLFRYFAKHKEQFSHIELRVPYGANFFEWIKDSSRPFEIKANNRPWMVRIIDVVEATNDIRVDLEDEVIIEIEDESCLWNNGIYKIQAVNNKLKIMKCYNIKPNMSMDIKGMTALLYGVYNTEELKFKGWISQEDSKYEEILDGWFPKKVFYNPYYF